MSCRQFQVHPKDNKPDQPLSKENRPARVMIVEQTRAAALILLAGFGSRSENSMDILFHHGR